MQILCLLRPNYHHNCYYISHADINVPGCPLALQHGQCIGGHAQTLSVDHSTSHTDSLKQAIQEERAMQELHLISKGRSTTRLTEDIWLAINVC